MGLPGFVDTVSADMRARIVATIAGIEKDHGVTMLFAVESGSRAWGFPSPDSDYDVRFVYAHPTSWYLSLAPGRDVIELPIDDELDINGWDVRKALNLLIKPNPVLFEWLSSPIRYAWNDEICAELVELSYQASHRPACLFHYLSIGRSQWRRHIGDRDTVNYKKYFYALRPALAIRWVRTRPEAPPPMNLQDLVGGIELDTGLIDDIARLMELKSRAREAGAGGRIAALDDLILSELDWAETTDKGKDSRDLRGAADALFRRILAAVD